MKFENYNNFIKLLLIGIITFCITFLIILFLSLFQLIPWVDSFSFLNGVFESFELAIIFSIPITISVFFGLKQYYLEKNWKVFYKMFLSTLFSGICIIALCELILVISFSSFGHTSDSGMALALVPAFGFILLLISFLPTLFSALLFL